MANLSLLAYVMNLFAVVIAFIAAYVLYSSNKKFLSGKFKEFSRWVVMASFLFLYSLIAQLYSLREFYFDVSADVIRIFNFFFTIIIGLSFIMAAKKLYEFSLDYGFSDKQRKQYASAAPTTNKVRLTPTRSRPSMARVRKASRATKKTPNFKAIKT